MKRYLHGQTPDVKVSGDVLAGQRLHQIFGKAAEQTAGLDFCRTGGRVILKVLLNNNLSSLWRRGNGNLTIYISDKINVIRVMR